MTAYCSRVLRRGLQLSLRRHASGTVRIACASGFWGDTMVSTPQLVKGDPQPDYIVYDYLSEITMSLLAKMKLKNEALGYTPDFLQMHMQPHLYSFKQKGIKIISNAGGVNPMACGEQLQTMAQKQGLDLKVAVVLGDDLLDQKDKFISKLDIDSGDIFPLRKIVSINAYFGAVPIKKALDAGADIVVTGRCVDSALVLGPLMHEYGWTPRHYDELALGSIAGHLVECGAQVTGGIFSDWHAVDGWENIGFPIAEFNGSDLASCSIIKPKKTGGRISFGTAAEQLVYEIGDPSNYILPDVTCDFRGIRVDEVERDHVVVGGATGRPPTQEYKVSATYADGYRCTAVCPIVGRDARVKGVKTAESIIKRCKYIFKILGLEDFKKSNIQVIGSGHYGETADPHAVVASIWIAVEHNEKRALEIFSREVAPAGTGMAPGLTNIAGGRPRVSPVLKLFSFMVPKQSMVAEIFMNGRHVTTHRDDVPKDPVPKPQPIKTASDDVTVSIDPGVYRIGDLAFTRSGDKGNTANIGVVARKPEFYPVLLKYCTSGEVTRHFHAQLEDSSAVTRYELPGIYGLNFVLTNALGGGGIASLRYDPQGKGYGQQIADMEIKVPEGRS